VTTQKPHIGAKRMPAAPKRKEKKIPGEGDDWTPFRRLVALPGGGAHMLCLMPRRSEKQKDKTT